MSLNPSKNFVAPVSALLVVLLVGWLIAKIKQPADELAETPNRQPSTSNLLSAATLDTDQDGLKDWEETLWRTDHKNSDSDGDGTGDGDEVKNGRNPALAAPNDELKKPEEIAEDKDMENLTEKMAQNFALGYFGSKGLSENSSLGASAENELARSLALSLEKNTAAYKDVYTKDDINVKESLDAKTYLNSLALALDKNFEGISKSEAEILFKMLSREDFSEITIFDKYIMAYKKTTFDFLKKNPVPPSYAALHIDLLNIMQNTMAAVENMKLVDRDPARAVTGFQLYIKTIARSPKFLKNLKEQIKKDGIVFEKSDPGKFFNKYLAQI